MEKFIKRKIKKGVAKDYQRNAKYFDYYYIIYNNQRYTLKLNGWNDMNLDVVDNIVTIDNKKIKLVWE